MIAELIEKSRLFGFFEVPLRLNIDTSFTGQDLLRTTLRGDNFYNPVGQSSPYLYGPLLLEVATNAPQPTNAVEINRLFYNFPVSSEITATIGALVRVDDPGMLGMWPSAYPADSVLEIFSNAGASGAYNLVNGLGSGAGVTVNRLLGAKGLTLSTNYVSVGASNGNPNEGGIGTDGA
jgi:hypothetical protein